MIEHSKLRKQIQKETEISKRNIWKSKQQIQDEMLTVKKMKVRLNEVRAMNTNYEENGDAVNISPLQNKTNSRKLDAAIVFAPLLRRRAVALLAVGLLQTRKQFRRR